MIHKQSEMFLQDRDSKRYFLDGHANSANLLKVSTRELADFDDPENSRTLFSANSPGGAADYVYLRELYDLDLGKVYLAALSACDTERVRLIRGEGVQAFSRALLSAGAAASLPSLWRVDDQTTAEFTRQFYYFALRGHLSKAEALRLTKLSFLDSGTKLKDPRIWAAFVLSGDGFTPLPSVFPWMSLALYAVSVIAILALLTETIRLRYKRRIYGKHNA